MGVLTELDDALELRPASSSGRFTAVLGDSWRIGHAVNGGLLLALLGTALRTTLAEHGHPDPFAVGAHYLSAARPGPATVVVDPIRSGRTISTAQVSLLQPDASGLVERVRALATYGDLGALGDDVRTSARPPDLPPLEACIGADAAPKDAFGDLPFLDRFDMRLDPDTVGWALGAPSGRGAIGGWLRMRDGREPDPLLLLLAVDSLPPVTFDLGLPGWTPTLQLAAHVRARPAPGWLRVQVSSRNLAGGLLEEDAEVWDSTDRLVAQSRQLAMVSTSSGRR